MLKALSYIFHPLFMPIAGVLLYFYITPRYFEPEFLFGKIFATAILTVVIPILSYFMLKNLSLVSDIHLKQVKERRYPLLMQLLFTLLLINMVYRGYELPELYFFFVGILASAAGALLLTYFDFKASLHMVGLGGLLFFVFGLSLHFSDNLLALISLLVLATGATATSRLHLKAHSYSELIVGFLVGSLPQFLAYSLWI